MAAALLAIALWSYLGMRRTLRGQLDHSLRSTFELQRLELRTDGHLHQVPSGLDEERFLREINRLVVARDTGGRIVHSNLAPAVDLPLDGAAFRLALAGELASADGRWHGRPTRSLYGPAPASALPVTVLQVTASREALERASRDVLFRMLATALLGSLASLVGAAWLARSALAPVHDIAAQATAVRGGRSGQRITAHADVAELRGLIEVLNGMLERLDRSTDLHRHIIRDLGHDLRTPITTLRASVEMALLTERPAARYREVLASTLEEIDRLALISDAMSLLARLESGDLVPALEEADLRMVATQAVQRARERGGGDEIRFDSPPEPVSAAVDPRLLGTALDQLLDNARHHTAPGTRVDVAVARADGVVRLTVEDQGDGVPEAMMAHLFSRFYRGDPARGRGAGAGLGLTLTAAIVDLHAGRIAAERGAAGGLRIRIEIPSAPRPASDGEERGAA
jgi:signal transduction histidine kinase